MRALRWLLALLALLAIVLVPFEAHFPLDPDEPAAADGSLAAGRARTIFDFDPLLGAFGDPRPPPDPDDPQNFTERFELERSWADRGRDAIVDLIGPIDWSLCGFATHQRLIAAIRTYYDVRGRQKTSFRLRGPRAARFIEHAWSEPVDRQIDAFVRQLVTSGFVQPREVSPQSYPEFAEVIADASALGKTCPPRNDAQL